MKKIFTLIIFILFTVKIVSISATNTKPETSSVMMVVPEGTSLPPGTKIDWRNGEIVSLHADSATLHRLRLSRELQWLGAPRRVYINMNHTRTAVNADLILPGDKHATDIMPYTGKGVVIGIIDCGIDPRHITFMTEDLSATRIREYLLTESAEESTSGNLIAQHYSTAADIMTAPLDSAGGGHGTHTASTAAGAWSANPYMGVAPDAELVLVNTGEYIYDDEIIYGMQAASDYAHAVGKPAVLSLSLGSNEGPHDGTSAVGLVSGSLAQRGDIICFAAGNDGRFNMSLLRNFAIDTTALRSCFYKWSKGDIEYCHAEAWSDDYRQLEAQLLVVNMYNRTILWESPWYSIADADEDGRITALTDKAGEVSRLPALADYFSGNITLSLSLYKPNGRFRVTIDAEMPGWEPRPQLLAFGIRSPQRASVRVYSDGYHSMLGDGGIASFSNGTPKESISDLASSPNVISIGMLNANESVTTLDGKQYTLQSMDFGDMWAPNNFSSYGTIVASPDSILPHILAPGSLVVAALTDAAPGMEGNYCADTLVNGRRYVWGFDSGTSMATPAAAGIIALWLEAIPTLTHNDILAALRHSSNKSVREKYPYSCAYGSIDAYAGLKYLLLTHSVPGVSADDVTKVMIRFLDGNSRADSHIECVLPEVPTSPVAAEFISTDGRVISSKRLQSQSFTLTLPGSPGIYILSIHGQGIAYSQKISVY